MFQQKQKAFTLVELIVVITILAILGTIAFISLQSYSSLSRDSVRISDVSKIKSTLELFSIDAGKYPNTTAGTAVTFSGETIWTQGIFGEDTFKNVDRLDKIPKDPLTEKEYTYSITNTKQEYELASLMEGDDFVMIKESYAADKTARVMITGHYNGKIAKIFADNKTYVLAVPTIISASGITIEGIMANNTFAYNGYKNLPFLYNGTSYNTLGETGLNLVDPNEYIVYSGSLSALTNPDDATARISMLKGLQEAYTGSIIEDSAIEEILAITDFTVGNPLAVSLAGIVVNNTLGASIATNSTSTLEATPLYTIPTTGLIAEYLFENSGDLGKDTSGSNNVGVNNGGLQIDGTSVEFDGIDYIDAGIKLPTIMSTSLWIKVPTTTTHSYLFGDPTPDASGDGYVAYVKSGGAIHLDFRVNNSNDNGFALDTTEVIQSGTWNHIAFIWDGTTAADSVKIYINGILEGQATSNGNKVPSNNNVAIGNVTLGIYSNLDGRKIDNFRVYDKILTQPEITNLYYEGLTDEQILAEQKVSCKSILDTGNSIGDGTYEIDPDGIGGSVAFDVHCDMTTDGGGWTLSMKQPSPGTYVGSASAMNDLADLGKASNLLANETWNGSLIGLLGGVGDKEALLKFNGSTQAYFKKGDCSDGSSYWCTNTDENPYSSIIGYVDHSDMIIRFDGTSCNQSWGVHNSWSCGNNGTSYGTGMATFWLR